VNPGALLDGRYRVGPLIARGGMSTVHRGTDTRLDRPVAIKVMDPRLAGDPTFRMRFEREARSAARIDHPSVVDVHDQGTDERPGAEPVLFLVMELVDGGTLRDVLRPRGALGVPAAFAVLDRVLAGLAEAHRLGMVHRDIKPENVLISRTGEVKVADFGLVTAGAQAGNSSVGLIMGTVAYLSPEQVASGAADARSDVYAAGILAYELLTGAPPYSGETAISVAYRHVTSRVPAPSLIAGEVPPELDALVLRATDPDPAARFADAAAMLSALRSLRTRLAVPRIPVPVPAAPAPMPGPAGAPPRTATHELSRAGTGAPPRTGTRVLAHDSGMAVRPGTRRPRRHRRAVLAGAVAVLAVLGLLAAVMSWIGAGRATVMPAVVGLERSAAERLLTEADLVATARLGFSDTVAAGTVAAADHPAGAELARGTEVALTVSNGRPVVPDIDPGTAVAAAEQLLREAGLTPVPRDGGPAGAGDEFDDDLPVGSVLRTDPGAGTVLRVGAAVALVLNIEPQRVTVPFLIGQSADAARAELAEHNLKAQVRSQLPFSIGLRTVIGQSPQSGTQVAPGTVVTLTTL